MALQLFLRSVHLALFAATSLESSAARGRSWGGQNTLTGSVSGRGAAAGRVGLAGTWRAGEAPSADSDPEGM